MLCHMGYSNQRTKSETREENTFLVSISMLKTCRLGWGVYVPDRELLSWMGAPGGVVKALLRTQYEVEMCCT